MKDEEILVPEGKNVIVGGRTYRLEEMGITQTILFTTFITKTIFQSQEKLKLIAEKTKDTKSNIDDIQVIFQLLSEQEICELFSIILLENDLNFIKKNLKITALLEIFADFLEYNDPDILKKNVQRIMGSFIRMFQKKEKTN